jgi:hypothetical protein
LARILAKEKAETFFSPKIFSLETGVSISIGLAIGITIGVSTATESSISGITSSIISIISGEVTANSKTRP